MSHLHLRFIIQQEIGRPDLEDVEYHHAITELKLPHSLMGHPHVQVVI